MPVELDAGGRRVQILMKPDARAKEKLEAGSLIEVDGVCRLGVFQAGQPPGYIEILSPGIGQVRVIEHPPLWTRRSTQRVVKISLFGLAGIIALGTAWGLGQRRKVKALRASEEKFRALGESLEKRVAARWQRGTWRRHT